MNISLLMSLDGSYFTTPKAIFLGSGASANLCGVIMEYIFICRNHYGAAVGVARL